MRRERCSILIVWLVLNAGFFNLQLFSQDTTYIKKYPYNGSLKISTGVLTQHLSLYSSGLSADSSSSVFVPNVNSSLGFSASWKILSFGYSFKIPNAYYTAEKFGTTKYHNFTLSSYYKWFGFEGFYRSYDGFFKPDKFYTASQIRKDVSFVHTGLNLYFFGNSKKFSFRAAFNQSRKQLKSAGGFVLMGELAYKKFSGDNSLLAPYYDRAGYFGKYKGLQSLSFGIIELRPGYAYNLVFRGGKYYFCPLVLGGIGISPYHFVTDSVTQNTFALHFDMNLRVSAGYDVGHFFANLMFEMDRNANYLSKTIIFAHTYFNINLTAGYRFGKKKEKTGKKKEHRQRQ